MAGAEKGRGEQKEGAMQDLAAGGARGQRWPSQRPPSPLIQTRRHRRTSTAALHLSLGVGASGRGGKGVEAT